MRRRGGERSTRAMPRILALLLLAAACSEEPVVEEAPVLVLPRGFPEMAIPEDNPLTAAKVELGRHLFYDERLSGNQTQSCGSCHEQKLAFADGRAVAIGSTGESTARNSQGLANVGYAPTLTWGNPVLTSLEKQILIPIFGEHPVELGVGANEAEVLQRLREDPKTLARFRAAFPTLADPVSWEAVVQALASFVRTMVSGNSAFDQYVWGDEVDVLSPAARRGMELFFSEELECHHCHGGFNFSGATVHAGSGFSAALFQNNGQYNVDGEGGYPVGNRGVFEITGDPNDMGRFRPPSLRNIALTAPYMHDGSVATLDEVIRNYERGGRLTESGPNAGDGALSPRKSGLVAGFTLSDDQRQDLIAFLHALTDESFLVDPRFADPEAP